MPHARYCSVRCYERHHRRPGTAQWERQRRKRRLAAIREDVLRRDGMRCRLCGGGVPEDVPVDHPLALTIDHLIPIAAGGDDDLANLVVAHRECNVTKGTHRYWWLEQPMAA